MIKLLVLVHHVHGFRFRMQPYDSVCAKGAACLLACRRWILPKAATVQDIAMHRRLKPCDLQFEGTALFLLVGFDYKIRHRACRWTFRFRET